VPEPSDEELMLALQRDEIDAFDALFRRHYERVRAMCARVTNSPSAGDDLAQETFLRVLRHRATFRGDARFSTWLYRIAHNLCLELAARHARDRKIAERWRAEVEPSLTPQHSDEAEQISAALASLAPDQREILVLCRYDDLPFAEIGEILGCTAGAARVRAHRALVALREAYNALGGKDSVTRRA
jgi:RNA polymerase sigma-70 factor (ECF subfamily)